MAAQAYENLPLEEKLTWERKAESAKAEYDKQVKEFFAQYPSFKGKFNPKKAGPEYPEWNSRKPTGRAKHISIHEHQKKYPDAPEAPTTPKQEFVQAKLNEEDPPPTTEELPELKQQFLEIWDKLSEKKRYKWIKKCLKHCAEYLDELEEYQKSHPDFFPLKPFKITNHLAKSELELWLKKNSWPVAPARSVIEQYVQEYLEKHGCSETNLNESRKLAEEEFKKLTATDKQLCQIEYRKKTLEYKKLIENHFAGTPEFLKPYVFSTVIPKKYRDGITLSVPKFSEEMIHEDHNEDPESDPLALPAESGPPAKKKKQNNPDSDVENVKKLASQSSKMSKGQVKTPNTLPTKPTPNQIQPQKHLSQSKPSKKKAH